MRDYDATTGRYLEPDPLGLVDGASVYGYARQDPGRWTDPRGESALGLVSGTAGADLLKPDKSDLNLGKWAGYGCAAVFALVIDGVTSEARGCEDDCPSPVEAKKTANQVGEDLVRQFKLQGACTGAGGRSKPLRLGIKPDRQ